MWWRCWAGFLWGTARGGEGGGAATSQLSIAAGGTVTLNRGAGTVNVGSSGAIVNGGGGAPAENPGNLNAATATANTNTQATCGGDRTLVYGVASPTAEDFIFRGGNSPALQHVRR